MVNWKSTAYQCQKWKQTTSTQIPFFTDVKTTKISTVPLAVSVEECHEMVRTQTSSKAWLVTMECSQQWIVSYQSTLMLQLGLFRCGPMFFFRSYSFQTIWWRLIPWRIEMVPYWKWTCHRPTLLESYQHKLIYERKTKNCHHSSLNWKSFTYMHCSLINGE